MRQLSHSKSTTGFTYTNFTIIKPWGSKPFSSNLHCYCNSHLPASLSSSVSCSLYVDNLGIWLSSPSVLAAVEATQAILIRLKRCSQYWCHSLNPSKCEAFFPNGYHQTNFKLHLHLFLFNFLPLRFNPTTTFFEFTFDRTLSFFKHVSLLKAKFFPRFKALRCISASSWCPSKESLSLLYKAFVRLLLTYASPGQFLFLSVTKFTKLECLHRAASRAITGCLSSSLIPVLLPWASLFFLRVTLTHFALSSYERALGLPISFSSSGLARHRVIPRHLRSSLIALRPQPAHAFP